MILVSNPQYLRAVPAPGYYYCYTTPTHQTLQTDPSPCRRKTKSLPRLKINQKVYGFIKSNQYTATIDSDLTEKYTITLEASRPWQ